MLRIVTQPLTASEPFAEFMTANLAGKFVEHYKRGSRAYNAFNYVELEKCIYDQCMFIKSQLKHLKPHSILAVVHQRDYPIRDWRSLAVFPILHNVLMTTRDVKVQYLFQITVVSDKHTFFNKRRRDGFERPWFPYRNSTEVSLFLIDRDSDATFKNWDSETDASRTLKISHIWRDDIVKETPSGFTYKSVLDLFCHPDALIYDCLTNKSCGFAIAAALMNRKYIGVYPHQNIFKQVHLRLSNIRQRQHETNKTRTVAAPTRRITKQKTNYLFSRWGGVRQDRTR